MKNGTVSEVSRAVSSIKDSRERLVKALQEKPTETELESVISAFLRNHKGCECDACTNAVAILARNYAT
jgi:hypothetical protein